MDDTLYRIVVERLAADAHVSAPAGELVLAGLAGELGSVLAGSSLEAQPAPAPPAAPVRAYLKSIAVQGFRGIGPSAVLAVEPGPGLTVVVGRNGSGKSSFADALEVLLTGDSFRFSGSAVWRQGWRSLHEPHAEVSAELGIEGQRGTTTVRRAWPDEATAVADGVAKVERAGQTAKPIETLGWTQALATFRPFLSYSELGSMLEEGPSKLYDALSAILGLEALASAGEALRQARLSRERAVKDARTALAALLPRLESVDDDRARTAHAVLSKKTWDLDAVPLGVSEPDAALGALRALAMLSVPEIGDLPSGLREAASRVRAVAGTDAGRALRVAGLLSAALDLHASHGDGDCPVCGRADALDATWRSSSAEEVARLRKEAASAEEAYAAASAAVRAARGLLVPAPAVLSSAPGVDVSSLQDAWTAWTSCASEDPDALAAHLESAWPALREAADVVRAAASAEVARREDAWRPVALDLAAWVAKAREAMERAASAGALKEAEQWVGTASEVLRDERFAPIAAEAQQVWEVLRQQSNVELSTPTLAGTKSRRRVALDVTIDGVGGQALGVMSQGELNSVALALFLPRATLEESPFRFVVIDDPVQSMDPSKVDGLAEVLDRAAKTRQVVVFTHDDRSPEAVQRMQIPANVVEVTRRAGSVVSLRPVVDRVSRHLQDAYALSREKELPPAVAARVVPGFLRLAIEAACIDAVRRRRLARGDAHVEVEKLFDGQKLLPLVALALFDDAERAGDVLSRVNKDYSPAAADALRLCNKGAHGEAVGDLDRLRTAAENLARKLQGLK